MYPLLLQPAIKNYLWGGHRLQNELALLYGTTDDIIAEAWMLSCNPAGESVIRNGPLAGKTLAEGLSLGQESGPIRFPILIKVIDAAKDLSIQVHPTDEYASENESGTGKTEMWYVLDAQKDAHIYYGFSQPISKDEMRQRIENHTIVDVLNRVPVKPGDVFLIQAGTIHFIGAGILIAEIQQNSDITYRVYDYDRRDAAGLARELHIEKALAVTDTTYVPGPAMTPDVTQMDGYRRTRLAACAYFTVDLVDVDTSAELTCDHTSFVSLLFLMGSGRIIFADRTYGDNGILLVNTWDSLYLPAGTGSYRLEGSCRVLITTP